MDDIIVFVIVHPEDALRKKEVTSELTRVGILDFYFVDGTMTHSKNIKERDACIINSHLNCFSQYVASRSKKHLLILEDDVKFLTPNPVGDIIDALSSLVHFPWWYSLHVGHFPLGPTIPVNSLLLWTGLPFTAHAVIWNATRVREVLLKVRHGRPYVIEGNIHLPLFSRFAVVKSIVTQSRRPKELVDLDSQPILGIVTRQFHFSDWNEAFVSLSVVSPIILAILVVAIFRKMTYMMAIPVLAVFFAITYCNEKK